MSANDHNSKDEWFYFIRFVESFPFVNFIYDLWLDDETPEYQRILDALNLIAVVDTLLLGATTSFATAISFDELIEADKRWAQPGFQFYSGNVSYSGAPYYTIFGG